MKACRYVAFLRGVNVGGRVVKMAVLKKLFEAMTCEGVETFIASGNVIFTSKGAASRIESRIENELERALGYRVSVFLRTPEEIAAIAARNPFDKPLPAGGRLFVGMLRERPSVAVRTKIAALSTSSDQFLVVGREVYWRCAVPSMKSIMSGNTLEKMLAQPATLRNVNTLRRLADRYPV